MSLNRKLASYLAAYLYSADVSSRGADVDDDNAEAPPSSSAALAIPEQQQQQQQHHHHHHHHHHASFFTPSPPAATPLSRLRQLGYLLGWTTPGGTIGAASAGDVLLSVSPPGAPSPPNAAGGASRWGRAGTGDAGDGGGGGNGAGGGGAGGGGGGDDTTRTPARSGASSSERQGDFHLREEDATQIRQYLTLQLSEFRKKLTKANVLLGGMSGAGKSSLVNIVFDTNYCKVGTGARQTTEYAAYDSDRSPVIIHDCQGLEPGAENARQYEESTRAYVKKIEAESGGNIEKEIHVVWYVINSASDRVLEYEKRLINTVYAGLPVIVILNKADLVSDSTLDELIDEITSDRADNIQAVLPTVGKKNCFRHIEECLHCGNTEELAELRAKARTICGSCGHSMDNRALNGLVQLVKCTVDVLPQVARKAFIHGQRIDIEQKDREATEIILRHCENAHISTDHSESVERNAMHMLIELGNLCDLKMTGEELARDTHSWLERLSGHGPMRWFNLLTQNFFALLSSSPMWAQRITATEGMFWYLMFRDELAKSIANTGVDENGVALADNIAASASAEAAQAQQQQSSRFTWDSQDILTKETQFIEQMDARMSAHTVRSVVKDFIRSLPQLSASSHGPRLVLHRGKLITDTARQSSKQQEREELERLQKLQQQEQEEQQQRQQHDEDQQQGVAHPSPSSLSSSLARSSSPSPPPAMLTPSPPPNMLSPSKNLNNNIIINNSDDNDDNNSNSNNNGSARQPPSSPKSV